MPSDSVRQDPDMIVELLPDDGSMPNNPGLPLIVYRGALRISGTDPAAVCEQVFAANGWGSSWRNGIYAFHHYHSTAHEVLAIARGEVRVALGGTQVWHWLKRSAVNHPGASASRIFSACLGGIHGRAKFNRSIQS